MLVGVDPVAVEPFQFPRIAVLPRGHVAQALEIDVEGDRFAGNAQVPVGEGLPLRTDRETVGPVHADRRDDDLRPDLVDRDVERREVVEAVYSPEEERSVPGFVRRPEIELVALESVLDRVACAGVQLGVVFEDALVGGEPQVARAVVQHAVVDAVRQVVVGAEILEPVRRGIVAADPGAFAAEPDLPSGVDVDPDVPVVGGRTRVEFVVAVVFPGLVAGRIAVYPAHLAGDPDVAPGVLGDVVDESPFGDLHPGEPSPAFVEGAHAGHRPDVEDAVACPEDGVDVVVAQGGGIPGDVPVVDDLSGPEVHQVKPLREGSDQQVVPVHAEGMQVVVAAGGVVGEFPVADVEMVQASVFGRDPEVPPAVVAELAHGVAVERLRTAVVVVPQDFVLPGRKVVHAAEIGSDPDAALAVPETPVDAFFGEVVSGDRPAAVLAAEEEKAAVRTDHVAVHVPPENRVDARDGELLSLGVEGGELREPARVDVEFAEVAVLHADQQFAVFGLDDGCDLVVA